MSNYIAEFRAPKQRMTRPFGYVIKDQGDGMYSVHRKYYPSPTDNLGGYSDGNYDLCYEDAAKTFADRVRSHVLSYPPETFDKGK